MTSVHLEESYGIRLAIEGCGHGTLHAIYASIEEACKQKEWPGVDLLIIGGDFQSVRNAFDLNCVSMPPKYREMCDFHEYYAGQRTAPCLTIFVGGNHEASNYLFELYYGGWVAPNIFYMGAANVLRLGPVRISGLSGIWKGFDYRKPHHERLPYNESDIKSIYHVRDLDVRKLLQIRTQLDIAVSHDWPQGIEWEGNWKQLFRFKKFFEEDARSGRLGSVAAKQVLDRLRPKYWFSAHLHCKYAAVVHHGDKPTEESLPRPAVNAIVPKNVDEVDLESSSAEEAAQRSQPVKNTDELDLDLDSDDAASSLPNGQQPIDGATARAVPKIANKDEVELNLDDEADNSASVATDGTIVSTKHSQNPSQGDAEALLADARAALPASFQRPKPRPAPEEIEHPPDITNPETNFLALDKCLPNRHFLQLFPVPVDGSEELQRPLQLEYDREWLSITRAFALNEPPTFGDIDARVPPAKTQAEYRTLIDEQRTWVDAHIDDSQLTIPLDFAPLAPVYDGGDFQDPKYQQPREYPNPQTAAFCNLLQIPNHLEISEEDINARLDAGPRAESESFGFSRGRGRGGFDRGRGRGGRGGGRSRPGGRGRGRYR